MNPNSISSPVTAFQSIYSFLNKKKSLKININTHLNSIKSINPFHTKNYNPSHTLIYSITMKILWLHLFFFIQLSNFYYMFCAYFMYSCCNLYISLLILELFVCQSLCIFFIGEKKTKRLKVDVQRNMKSYRWFLL